MLSSRSLAYLSWLMGSNSGLFSILLRVSLRDRTSLPRGGGGGLVPSTTIM